MSKWFGVRSVFQHQRQDISPGSNLYEERVVIVRAADFATALGKAESEAGEYACDDDVQFLGFSQAFEIYEDPSSPPAEVFSLMRESPLDAEAYIDSFFSTGSEREKDKDDDTAA
jgi:hypothetical protein